MLDGNEIPDGEVVYETTPDPSELEQEIQTELDRANALVDTFRKAKVGQQSQPFEVASAFLCEARTYAREAAALPEGSRRRDREQRARMKLQAARNLLAGDAEK